MTLSATATIPLGLSPARRTLALWIVLIAFFIDILDATIVNVAIPSIQANLGASYSAIQWIVAGYSLTFALFLITGGRLGDIFGYKALFLIGVAGFVVASGFSGFASTTEMLVAARLLQGFTAALMVPQILSTIQVMYPTAKERQGVSAFYGAVAGVATVGGPILGALLVASDFWGLGWRAIFLVNIPIGILAIVAAAIVLPNVRSPHPLRLDLMGVGLVVLAMLMLMYPLIQGRELDWPDWTFVAMAASLLVFALFSWTQQRIARRGGAPLVVPRLFRHRSFVAGIVLSGAFFAIASGFFLMLALFLQVGLGYGVLKAGLTGIPFSIGVSAAAGLSGPVLVPRFGRSIISTGVLVMALGLALFGVTADYFGGEVTPWQLAPALLICGAGMGFVVAPVYPFILAEVPIPDAGSASGIINAVGQIGGAMGVAAIGVIFFGLIADRADTSVASVRPALATELEASGLPPFAVPTVLVQFESCFRDRATAKDFSAAPESCRAGAAAQAAFAASQPAVAAAVAESMTRFGRTANQRNFTGAMARSLLWEIGALVVLFFVSFLLPRQPREEAALAAI